MQNAVQLIGQSQIMINGVTVMIAVLRCRCISIIVLLLAFIPVASFSKPDQIYWQSSQYYLADQSKSYLLFSGNPLRLVFPTTKPDLADVDKPLSTFLSQGEKRSISFSVMGLKNLGMATATVTDLVGKHGVITKNNVQVRVVRYGERQGLKWWPKHHRGSMVVPLYLQSNTEFKIQRDVTQQIWVTVSAPDDIIPGVYKGRVNIMPANGENKDIEIKVEVLPIKLINTHDYFLALYMYLSDKKDKEYYRKALLDMNDHGLNGLAVIGNLGEKLQIRDSKVKIYWSGDGVLELALNAAKSKPLQIRKVLWLMAGKNLGDVYPWCKRQESKRTISFDSCYMQVVKQIEERRKKMGWPEIIYQPIDEPSVRNQSYTIAKKTYPILDKVNGIRTEINAANNRYSIPVNKQLRKYIDIFTFHSGPFAQRGKYDEGAWSELRDELERDNKSIWFYNIDNTGWHAEPMRYAFGYGLYKAGGSGMLQWSYQVPVYFKFNGDGQAIIDNNSFHVYMYPENKLDSGGPSLGYEMIREGINDLRYLGTLRELIENGDFDVERSEANAYWDHVMEELDAIDYMGASGTAAQGRWTVFNKQNDGITRVSGDLKMHNGLKYDDYDRIRRLIAGYIIMLSGAE